MFKKPFFIILLFILVGCHSKVSVCQKNVEEDYYWIQMVHQYDEIKEIHQKEIYSLPKTIDQKYLKNLDEFYEEDARYFRQDYTISFYQEVPLSETYSARFTLLELLKKGYHCETT